MKPGMKAVLTRTTLGLTVLALAACAADDPNRRSKIGAGIGAVVGAVIGNEVDDEKGKYIGAVAGAIAGAAVGNYMDKQQAELEKELAQEAARKELSITELPGNALKVGIASDVSFDSGKAEIRPTAEATYNKIASILKNYDKTVIHVVGHTDTVGASEYNQTLSDRRASAVGNVLMAQGVPSGRIQLHGRGERELLVPTKDGVSESRNRRVDIVIKPVVEGQEQQAYAPPPYLGK